MKARRSWAAAVAAASVLASAACNGSKADEKKNDAPNPATGTPIKIASIVDSLSADYFSAGLKAAVADVNGHGGINNHPISLTICRNNDNPNTAATCARDAVSSGAVAVVGGGSNFGSSTNPVLQAAGMAAFGSSPYVTSDFTSPIFFPLVGGSLGTAAGQGAIAADLLHSKHPAVGFLDVPAGQIVPSLLNQWVFKSRNVSTAAQVAIPRSSADVSAQVASLLAKKPDSVILVLTTDLASKVTRTIRQQGYKGPVVLAGAVFSKQLLKKQLGGATDDLYMADDFDRGNGRWKTFSEQQEKAGHPEYANGTAMQSWLAIEQFAEVARRLPNVTRKAFLDVLKKTTLNTGGLTGPIDFTKPSTILGGTAPRVFNTEIFALKVEGDKITTAGSVKAFR
ncbi:ABC transporter substrate-binding protein [Actinomadura sp. LD22]|uniref:ABC transporter substrate-binding protein n=1 Tax=Actinomadura physcomitrii TaxID=2650748 RepID=A0A6I4M1S1_9ACTN|nr:ABC transporter substrate-binding protein [Actinomadura physcomitrii]MVZ99897.1 ABC transporter substrate-binding protein [Actinomadura physcomitrii]